MRTPTLLYGSALVILGLAGYGLTGAASVTALIPAFFGLPVLALGAGLGSRPRLIIAVVILALLGLGGSAPGLAGIGALVAGEAERPAAVISQSIMAVLSVVFLLTAFARRGKVEST